MSMSWNWSGSRWWRVNTPLAGYQRSALRPGVYFRMLMIGYFEGLRSERGMGRRVSDLLTLRRVYGTQFAHITRSTLYLTPYSSVSRKKRLLFTGPGNNYVYDMKPEVCVVFTGMETTMAFCRP